MLGFWPCYACWDDSQDTAYQNVPLQFICVTMHDRLYSAWPKSKKVSNQWHIIYIDTELPLQNYVKIEIVRLKAERCCQCNTETQIPELQD